MGKYGITYNIMIAGTFTIEPLKLLIEKRSREVGQNTEVVASPYNQVLMELLNRNSIFSSTKAILRVVFLRVEDWLRELNGYDKMTQADEKLIGKLNEYIQAVEQEYVKAFEEYAKGCICQTDVVICPSSESFKKNRLCSDLIEQAENRIMKKISGIAGIQVYKSSEYQGYYGFTEIDDPIRNELGHIPYTDEYYSYLGLMTVRRLHCILNKPYKVIVTDCDNTLWEGIAAETDPGKVRISEKEQVLQSFLVNQYEKGMLLCLCSKNIEEDVWKVFEHNGQMILKKEQLADWRINWKTKSENIEDMAKSFNLGLESFIFIDDNEAECQEVKSRCPEVFIIHMNQHMEAREEECFLNKLWVFDTLTVTREDKQKTRFYQENRKRETAKQNTSYTEFLKNLNLKVSMCYVTEHVLDRVEQLFRKTNQFNFTGRRYTKGDLCGFLNKENYDFLYVSVEDRFGSYGIVGVMLCYLSFRKLVVDSFLLSCRVLGRGIEYEMLAKAGQEAEKRKVEKVEVNFSSTVRNEPAKLFLDKAVAQYNGEKNGNGNYVFDAEKISKMKFIPEVVLESEEQRMDLPDKKDARLQTGDKQRYLIDFAQICFSSGDSGHGGKNEVQNIKNAFAKVLNIKYEDLEEEKPLEQYGMNSYQIVDITALLVKKYKNLPLTALYECRTISELSNFILEHCQKSGTIRSRGEAERRFETENYDGEIAISGINGVFPGSSTIQEYWNMLKNGKTAIGDVPSERWDLKKYYDVSGKDTGKSYGKVGGFLKHVFEFDEETFHISPKEARTMDPQQRLLLEVVRGLYDDAGYTGKTMERETGVFIGAMTSDFGTIANIETMNGNMNYRNCDLYQLANRISYYFDLHGPSLTVDTACSASGTAFHLACEAIKHGDCKAAIVGGVNLFLLPSRFIQYSRMGFLSRKSYCSPFGEGADGTIFGEGIGAILLKPLKTAIKDGDNIYGVIKSTAINSGGKTNGFTVPSPKAQEDLIYRALDRAGIDAQTVRYFETHGTGTYLGDPIEIRGMTQAFEKNMNQYGSWTGRPFCRIGSVKANIGHLESAAFIAGVIKVLLQMRYHVLVPSLHSEVPNSRIAFEDTPFILQHDCEVWTQEKDDRQSENPLRAGISSFGAGGSNVCAILEEFRLKTEKKTPVSQPLAVLLSAKSKTLLIKKFKKLLEYLEDTNMVNENYQLTVEQIAYTLQSGREHDKERAAIIVSNMDELKKRLKEYIEKDGVQNLFYPDAGEGCAALDLAEKWINQEAIDWSVFYSGRKITKVSLPGMLLEGNRYQTELYRDESDKNDIYLMEILKSVEDKTLELEDAKELIGGIQWEQ